MLTEEQRILYRRNANLRNTLTNATKALWALVVVLVVSFVVGWGFKANLVLVLVFAGVWFYRRNVDRRLSEVRIQIRKIDASR